MSNIEQDVQQWLEQVVIGLNLCPFAAKPHRNQQIKIQVSESISDMDLLEDIYQELQLLKQTPSSKLETTLVVVPRLLADFDDYNQFIGLVEALITQFHWEGEFQVATFHPDYCFYGAQPDDPENLTNRSPYPIFHLIREASIEKVLAHYPDPEAIPERNIRCVQALTKEEKQKLFPYLFISNSR